MATVSSPWLLLVDPATLAMFGTACGVVWQASSHSLHFHHSLGHRERQESMESTSKSLLWAPVTASVSLLLLFLYFDALMTVYVVLVGFSCFFSSTFAMYSMFTRMQNDRSRVLSLPVWLGSQITMTEAMSMAYGATVVLLWLFTGHWLFVDLLACAMSFTMVVVLRLKNIRLLTIILGAFFLYDVFWVFVSPLITPSGKSVMVAVARKATQRNLPVMITFPRLWTAGRVGLGTGDVAMPGLLVAFLHRFDHSKPGATYRIVSMMGYLSGLVMAYVAVIAMDHGQPALLYIVPAMLGPVLWKAHQSGDLEHMWHNGPLLGFDRVASDDDEEEDEESGRT